MREGEECDPRVANSSPGRLGNFPTSNLGNSACSVVDCTRWICKVGRQGVACVLSLSQGKEM